MVPTQHWITLLESICEMNNDCFRVSLPRIEIRKTIRFATPYAELTTTVGAASDLVAESDWLLLASVCAAGNASTPDEGFCLICNRFGLVLVAFDSAGVFRPPIMTPFFLLRWLYRKWLLTRWGRCWCCWFAGNIFGCWWMFGDFLFNTPAHDPTTTPAKI